MNFIKREWIIDSIIEFLRKLCFPKYIKILFDLYYDVFYSHVLKKNIVLMNKNLNETCYIIGNGISLNNFDIKSLNNSFTMCSNELFKYKHYKKFNPKIHVIVEPFYGKILGRKYYRETYDLYKGLYDESKNKSCLFFFHISLKQFFSNNNLFQDRDVYYVNTVQDNYKKKSDLSSKFYFGDGAFSFMMGLSHYMGFKKIILIGCGYTYNPRQLYHCYSRYLFDKKKINEITLLKEIKKIEHDSKLTINLYEIDQDENHYLPIFTVNYENDKLHQRHLNLNRFMKKNGVQILNMLPSKKYKSPVFESFN